MTTTDPENTTETEADVSADRIPFTAFLSDHRYGELNTELTDALADLVAEVSSLDKGGELVLTIKVAPEGAGIVVKDVVSVKLPEPPPPVTFYYPTGDGGLSKRDPRQPQLPTLEN